MNFIQTKNHRLSFIPVAHSFNLYFYALLYYVRTVCLQFEFGVYVSFSLMPAIKAAASDAAVAITAMHSTTKEREREKSVYTAHLPHCDNTISRTMRESHRTIFGLDFGLAQLAQFSLSHTLTRFRLCCYCQCSRKTG